MSKWTSWAGGKCPVSENAVVDVMFRNEFVRSGVTADNLAWMHLNGANSAEIVAYRLSEQQEELK